MRMEALNKQIICPWVPGGSKIVPTLRNLVVGRIASIVEVQVPFHAPFQKYRIGRAIRSILGVVGIKPLLFTPCNELWSNILVKPPVLIIGGRPRHLIV